MEYPMGKPSVPEEPCLDSDYDFTYEPFDSLENEINEFYSPRHDWELCEELDATDFKKMLSWNLGIQRGFVDKTAHIHWIMRATIEILKIPDLFVILYDNLHDDDVLSIFYNILLIMERSMHISRADLDCLKFLQKLLGFINDITLVEPSAVLAKILLVFLKLLGIFTNGEKGLRELKNEKRKMYGLNNTENFDQKVGLVEYKNHQYELIKRYPGYMIDDSIDFKSLGLMGFVNDLNEFSPPCLRKLIDEIPTSLHPYTEEEYVPKGIKESFDILQKNLYISLSIIEKKNFKRNKLHSNAKLEQIKQLYKIMYPSLGKTVSILLKLLYSLIVGSPSDFKIFPDHTNFNLLSREERNLLLQSGIQIRRKSLIYKSVSGILLLLLKAFKVHHVLEFENFCSMLADQNCQLIFLKLLVSWFPSLAALLKLNRKIVPGETWLKQKDEPLYLDFFVYSQKKDILGDEIHYTELENTPSDASTISEPIKSSFSSFYSTINLLRILQKITKRKYCRLLHLIHLKTCNILKRIILVNNRDLQFEALKLLKSQIPFLGKKWKFQNTHIISTMYKIILPRLLDDTLAIDLEIHPAESAKEENRLREIIREYHSLFYPIENASSLTSSKDDLEQILVLSVYSENLDIPEASKQSFDSELDDHFRVNYKSWLDREARMYKEAESQQ